MVSCLLSRFFKHLPPSALHSSSSLILVALLQTQKCQQGSLYCKSLMTKSCFLRQIEVKSWLGLACVLLLEERRAAKWSFPSISYQFSLGSGKVPVNFLFSAMKYLKREIKTIKKEVKNIIYGFFLFYRPTMGNFLWTNSQ